MPNLNETDSAADSPQGFSVEQSGSTLLLSGVLDFSTASDALKQVEDQLENSQSSETPVDTISLADITRSNSAALALMIEWLAIARRQNQPLRFDHIPDSLRQISTVCQVDSLI